MFVSTTSRSKEERLSPLLKPPLVFLDDRSSEGREEEEKKSKNIIFLLVSSRVVFFGGEGGYHNTHRFFGFWFKPLPCLVSSSPPLNLWRSPLLLLPFVATSAVGRSRKEGQRSWNAFLFEDHLHFDLSLALFLQQG